MQGSAGHTQMSERHKKQRIGEPTDVLGLVTLLGLLFPRLMLQKGLPSSSTGAFMLASLTFL